MELNKLHLMDCMEGMKEFPDNYFDLAIIDAPYGININNQSQGRGGGVAKKIEYIKKDLDKQAPSCDYFDLLIQKSKNQIILGANHFIENIPNKQTVVVGLFGIKIILEILQIVN